MPVILVVTEQPGFRYLKNPEQSGPGADEEINLIAD